MDMSKYGQSESNDLKAKDFVGKNLKVTISKWEIRQFPATDKMPANEKPVLHFEGKEKTLVLNATNVNKLCEAYGHDGDDWIGKQVGLTVADYTSKGFGHGWVVTPLDVTPPDFDDEIPF
jgi:hypothetical protein